MEVYDYDDLKRLYANTYAEKHGKVLADDFEGFMKVMSGVIMSVMLESPDMKEMIEERRAVAVREQYTAEQWNKELTDIMQTLFFMSMDAFPVVRSELAKHVYDELRKEN